MGNLPPLISIKVWGEILAFLEDEQGSLAQPIRALHLLSHGDGFKDGHR